MEHCVLWDSIIEPFLSFLFLWHIYIYSIIDCQKSAFFLFFKCALLFSATEPLTGCSLGLRLHHDGAPLPQQLLLHLQTWPHLTSPLCSYTVLSSHWATGRQQVLLVIQISWGSGRLSGHLNHWERENTRFAREDRTWWSEDAHIQGKVATGSWIHGSEAQPQGLDQTFKCGLAEVS